MAIKRTLQQWSVEDSTELYGIRNWGAGYFGVSPEGDVVIYPSGEKQGRGRQRPRGHSGYARAWLRHAGPVAH